MSLLVQQKNKAISENIVKFFLFVSPLLCDEEGMKKRGEFYKSQKRREDSVIVLDAMFSWFENRIYVIIRY